jgi:CheY-like chemotaxis protein
MHVLVADDDDVTRLLLRSALAKLGHQVIEAANGRDALAAWEKDQQPLIISDWEMPDLDGLELCRRIRALNDTAFAYIILLTSRTGKADYFEAMEAGADDFISKPFDKEQIATRVRVAGRILDLHENLRTANTTLERRVAERTTELEKALAAKSEFLSRASHELRTPMNHVLGFAQLLALDPLNPDQKESVDQILTSGTRLLALIDHILQVSQSEPNELNFLEAQE